MRSVKKDIISWFKKKRDGFHIPKLSWWKRLLLYIISTGVIVLTLLSLVYSFVPAFVSYVLYAVSALLLCYSMYYLVRDIIFMKKDVIEPAIHKHDFTRQLVLDYSYRTVCFTYLSFIINTGFAVMNGIYGIRKKSWWFLTFAVYYALLSVMRARILVTRHKNKSLEENELIKRNEWNVYQTSGKLFFLLAITLAGTVTLIASNYGSKSYPGLLIFAVATYTFYKITIAVINLFKVKKLGAPLVAVIRQIGYADALASLMLLQTAMFSSFSDGDQLFERRMNSITGIFACSMILAMGVYMIWNGTKHLN